VCFIPYECAQETATFQTVTGSIPNPHADFFQNNLHQQQFLIHVKYALLVIQLHAQTTLQHCFRARIRDSEQFSMLLNPSLPKSYNSCLHIMFNPSRLCLAYIFCHLHQLSTIVTISRALHVYRILTPHALQGFSIHSWQQHTANRNASIL
jgi:hypothetical protein